MIVAWGFLILGIIGLISTVILAIDSVKAKDNKTFGYEFWSYILIILFSAQYIWG